MAHKMYYKKETLIHMHVIHTQTETTILNTEISTIKLRVARFTCAKMHAIFPHCILLNQSVVLLVFCCFIDLLQSNKQYFANQSCFTYYIYRHICTLVNQHQLFSATKNFIYTAFHYVVMITEAIMYIFIYVPLYIYIHECTYEDVILHIKTEY